MQSIISSLTNFGSIFRITDVVDIAVVAYAFYKIAVLVRETRAAQLVKGIVLLLIATWASELFQLNTINYILRNTMQVGVLAILVVFQPELRRALEKVGRTSLGKFFATETESVSEVAQQISRAAAFMSGERIGALIVLERETKVGDIIRTGTVLEARVTSELLVNLFTPNTPLHDGAVIIRENRIMAAGCFLPLTQNEFLSRELGTRHRAALGMSESSDAVVVLVSEETGNISLASEGNLTRSLNKESLQKIIEKAMQNRREESAQDKLKRWRDKLWKK